MATSFLKMLYVSAFVVTALLSTIGFTKDYPLLRYDSADPIGDRIETISSFDVHKKEELEQLIELYRTSDEPEIQSVALKAIKRASVKDTGTRTALIEFLSPEVAKKISGQLPLDLDHLKSFFHADSNYSPPNLNHWIAEKNVPIWTKQILPTLGSADKAAKTWPETSMWGGIWTAPGDKSWFSDKAADLSKMIEVKFALNKKFRFYDQFNSLHVLAWREWEQKNSGKINIFTQKQIEKLKEYRLPYHSEFYNEMQLAGVVDFNDWEYLSTRKIRTEKINAYVVINMRSVDSLQVTRAGKKTIYDYAPKTIHSIAPFCKNALTFKLNRVLIKPRFRKKL